MTNREKLVEIFGQSSCVTDHSVLKMTWNEWTKWLNEKYKAPDISEPVQFVEGKDGQLSFLKEKELYHFEGWASWVDDMGYPQAGQFDLYTQAKSEAQAINCIKAQIKKRKNMPMNKRVDICLDDGASTLTKVLPPISDFTLIYPNGSGVTITVKARNINEVCKKLETCGIPTAVFETDIQLGGIADEKEEETT